MCFHLARFVFRLNAFIDAFVLKNYNFEFTLILCGCAISVST